MLASMAWRARRIGGGVAVAALIALEARYSFAQAHAGGRIGARSTALGGDVDLDPAIRPAVAGFVNIDVTTLFAVGAELQASSSGSEEYRLRYLSAPLLVHARHRVGANAAARISLGLAPAWLATAEYIHGTDGGGEVSDDVRPTLRVWDVGLVAATAVQVQVGRVGYLIELRYVRGTMSIDEDLFVTNRELGLWIGAQL